MAAASSLASRGWPAFIMMAGTHLRPTFSVGFGFLLGTRVLLYGSLGVGYDSGFVRVPLWRALDCAHFGFGQPEGAGATL